MARLTQIKETKKGRLALFFDGEFAFSLDEDTFADAGLHQDDELEDWQIEELRKKSETRRALDKAMDYLSLRDHAAGELYQKLCRKFELLLESPFLNFSAVIFIMVIKPDLTHSHSLFPTA